MAKYQTNYFKTDLLTNATKAQRAKAQADAAKALSKSGKTSKPTTKKMSAAMATWVQANRGKLKNPTAKQKALFNQYDALKKAGNLPDTSKAKRRSSVAGQPSAKVKPAGVAPVQPASRVQQGASAVKASKEKSKKTGVHGKSLPPNPQLKSQPKKSKLNPQQRRKAGQIKRRRGMSPADAAKSISDKLRLTYKKGQIVQRGGKFYKSDGKGGFTLVHSKQF